MKKANPVHKKQLPKREKRDREREREKERKENENRGVITVEKRTENMGKSHVFNRNE